MHILIIPSWYKTPKNPGSGSFFEEQARMFQKRGHQVGILFPEHNLRFLGSTRYKITTPKSFVDKGLPTYYSFSQSYIPKIETPTQFDIKQSTNAAYKKFKEYIKENGKPDVIHAHSVIWGGVVAKYISEKENIPYFITEHFSGWILNEKMQSKKVYREILLDVVSNSTLCLAVSSFLKNKMIELYDLSEDKIKVVPNIVNDLFFKNRTLIKKGEYFRLSIIGYLIDKKNHFILFKAIQNLIKMGYKVELKVIGTGELENSLREYAVLNKLSNNIYFLGQLNRDEIVAEILKSHAIISASTFETFGVTIIEGLALGRPVIVLDSGGPRDIVRKEDGVIFKENTPEAFTNAIKYVIDNYESYNQGKIAQDCVMRFGESAIYERLMNFYDSIN